MSIIEAIRTYIATCPLLEGGYIHVNYLDMEPTSFTIDEIPAEPVMKRYADGSSRRQVLFLFASAELYSQSAVENLKACGFYENFADWLSVQNDMGNLPTLPAGCEAQTIEATTNGYAFTTNEEQNVQRYQIQCKLTYFKEAN